MLWSTAWFLSFFSFFFSLERYTKRQERFCYFLMKTLRTLKYPVFIRVTNSNSKVHPFIDMMWREPISARILGEWNVQSGEKPRGCGLLPLSPLQGDVNWVSGTYQAHLKNCPHQEPDIDSASVAGERPSRRRGTKTGPWQWSSAKGTGRPPARTGRSPAPRKAQLAFSSQTQLAPSSDIHSLLQWLTKRLHFDCFKCFAQ